MKEKLHRKKKHTAGKVIVVIVCALFAFLFIMPTVLTITNSFMEQSEINSNYGKIFQNFTGGSKTYISDKVTLKFIPDKVSLSQYITALIKSPDYLFKFWNSVILVVPIVIFQVATAALAAYGFTRWRGENHLHAEQIPQLYVLLLCHTDAYALSGDIGSELLGKRLVRNTQYPLGDNLPRNVRPVLGIFAYQIHAANTRFSYRSGEA